MSSDDKYDHWRSQPKYAVPVAEAKALMPQDLRALVDGTECFAWLWVDDQDGSECGEEQCPLRSYCRNAWQQAQVTASRNTERKHGIDSGPSASTSKTIESEDKYARPGYVPLGRPVDLVCTGFVQGLGDVRRLPGSWSSSRDHLVGLSLKATQSYHAVITRGVVVARLWTDTIKAAKIDLVPELVSCAALLAQKTSMRPPTKIPDASWPKTRPCTHRVKVSDPKVANALGALIKRKFNT